MHDFTPFSLTYTVEPSFWTQPYAVRLAFEEGFARLYTRNAPGLRCTSREDHEPAPESRSRRLPDLEHQDLLALMDRIRIPLQAEPGCPVTDSGFASLKLKRGALEMTLGWYHEPPEAWDGLKPLVDFLDHVAQRYGRPRRP